MTRVLVVGATGLVGSAAVEHFAEAPGSDVVGLSRRVPQRETTAAHVAVDLLDRESCFETLASLAPISHVLYCALHERPELVKGWRDPLQMDTNLAMLRNLLDALATTAPRLSHICVMQGGKAYGTHLRRVPVPAKERWPRPGHGIFYWAQEDLLRERQRTSSWTFSVLRPQRILGLGPSSPMNIIRAIGLYAMTMRELGNPLWFPGRHSYANACSDSRLIARAFEFCASTPSCANEIYNVVNGDVITWPDLWPAIADLFSMEVGDQRPISLAAEMPRYADLWDTLAAEQGLRATGADILASTSWEYADLVLGSGPSAPHHNVMSPIKLWRAGFRDCEDTEESIVYWLSRLRDSGMIGVGQRRSPGMMAGDLSRGG